VKFPLCDLYPGGARGDYFNQRGKTFWENKGVGDWLDADGVPQGTKPFATVKNPPVGRVAFDVTALCQDYSGICLRLSSGDQRFASRQNPDPAIRPKLVVNGVEYPCIADTYITGAGVTEAGEEPLIRLQPNLYTGYMEFDVPEVVTSAVLTLTLVSKSGTGDANLYKLRRPEVYIGDEANPQPGLAAAFPNDVGIEQHPDVIAAFDWSDGFEERFKAPGRLAFGPGALVGRESVDGQTWLKLRYPIDETCSGREHNGTAITARYPLGVLPASINPPPLISPYPQRVFARYSLILLDDYYSDTDTQLAGGKFAGFEGMMGHIINSPQGRIWEEYGPSGMGLWHPPGRYPEASFRGFSGRGLWTAAPYENYIAEIDGYKVKPAPRGNPMFATTPVGGYWYNASGSTAGSGSGTAEYWRNTVLVPGRRYDIEQEIVMNTVSQLDQFGNGVGNPDGYARAWVNGRLVFARVNIIWRHHPFIGPQEFWLSFKNGGITAPCEPHHFLLGPVVISRSYIGPRRTVAAPPPPRNKIIVPVTGTYTHTSGVEAVLFSGEYTEVGESTVNEFTAPVAGEYELTTDPQKKLTVLEAGTYREVVVEPPPPPDPDLNPVLVNMAADTWTRLPDGLERVVLQTKPMTASGDANCSELMQLIPLTRALPLIRGYGMFVITDDGEIFFFGGGHSTYAANEMDRLRLRTNNWQASSYTPDKGCSVVAQGPATSTPNNRPWWEHQANRGAWDKRVRKLMLIQRCGTWFYDRDTEQYERALDGTLPNSPSWVTGDYLGGCLVFSELFNAMLWVRRSDAGIYKFNYSPYSWTKIHDLDTGGADYPGPDTGDGGNDAAAACQGPGQRIYFLRHRTPSVTQPDGSIPQNPKLFWFDPATNISGQVDMTNGPQGDARNLSTAQYMFPGAIACYHDELYVPGRAAGNKLIVWVWNQTTGWRTLPDFPVAENTESSPFELDRKVPTTGGPGDVHSHTFGMFVTDVVHDRLILSLRHSGGGGTLQGGTNGGINPVTGLPLKSIEIYALKRAA
jgi:hypothetical protein